MSIFVIGWQGGKRDGKDEEGGTRERRNATRPGNWSEKGGRRRKQMLFPEAVPCRRSSVSFTGAWAQWVCIRSIKPELEKVSLPRGAHPLTSFSNVKQPASENTGRSVRGHCAAGGFIPSCWGHQPDGWLLLCLPSDADGGCKQSSGWEQGVGQPVPSCLPAATTRFVHERQNQRCSPLLANHGSAGEILCLVASCWCLKEAQRLS